MLREFGGILLRVPQPVRPLMIIDCRVDEGPHIKRFQPKDRGRAHPILKRTSHITIGVEERS